MAREQLAGSLNLSRQVLDEAFGRNSTAKKFPARVGFARTVLLRLSLANSPSSEMIQITPEGRKVLAGDRTPVTATKAQQPARYTEGLTSPLRILSGRLLLNRLHRCKPHRHP